MPELLGIMEHFPYAGLFGLLVLGGIGFPFPEGATLILCGFLISSRVTEPLPSLAAVFAGVLTGDSIAYLFGRKYGRMIVRHRRFRGIISPERLLLFEERFRRWGPLVVLIGGRLVSGVFLMSGVLGMPLPRLLLLDALSSVLAIALWVGTGYIGGRSLSLILADMARIEHYAALVIVAVIVVLLFVRSSRHGRREE